MAHIDPLIDTDWLSQRIQQDNLKILDCTWCLPNSTPNLPNGYIPGTQIFDLDEVATPHPKLAHMLPSAEIFTRACSERGIKNTDIVVCYDKHGVFSSPRGWWTFKMFGHAHVYVLDGGLPAWITAGYAVADKVTSPVSPSDYEVHQPLSQLASQNDVKQNIGLKQIIDARPPGRFTGATAEPRQGLRSGRIPQSLNLPFTALRTPEGRFKPREDIADIVAQAGIDLSHPIITTCGSGITAAGLALTFYRLGATDISVYDGSWAEWGASDAPIDIG